MHYGLQGDIEPDTAEIERRRQQAGCFVLLSNIPSDGDDGLTAQAILERYKNPHAIERNFSFLKDEAIVNSIFLKTPARIEALGLILLLSLLIWRLIEHQMRKHLADTDTTLPGWNNKPTQRPTGYMLMMKFKGIVVLKRGNRRRLANPLSPTRLAFLNALGLSPDILTYSPRDGWRVHRKLADFASLEFEMSVRSSISSALSCTEQETRACSSTRAPDQAADRTLSAFFTCLRSLQGRGENWTCLT